MKKLKITIVADTPSSWIMPYVNELTDQLVEKYDVALVHDPKSIERGDLAFFLACQKIVPPEILALNKHNLVVHESKLPKGRGWSPLSWQILEGKKKIAVTLFEAAKDVDSGDIYLQEFMIFDGSELVDELREKQGKMTMKLVLDYAANFGKIVGKSQKGKPTYYPRRRPIDSRMNPNLSLKKLFNRLRIADNERYPAFFDLKGWRYVLRVTKTKIPDEEKK